jgi:large subunit ribosomal protein L19
MNEANKKIRPGDIIRVSRKVIEGDKERIQVLEGMVIARKHGNDQSATITMRKVSGGIGVEFIFPLNSPKIESIEILRRSKTRRAKLYYLRERTGKGTRVKEDQKAGLLISAELNKKEEERKSALADARKESLEAKKKEEGKKEEEKKK